MKGGAIMTLYATNGKKPLHLKFTKNDVAGLVNAKYGTKLKPDEIGGKERKRK